LKKNKPVLNAKATSILKYIDDHGGMATAHEISKDTGISYKTVQKYLKMMLERKILTEQLHDDEEEPDGNHN
jgi:response regulator of citrate/malate metabolism